MPTSVESWRCDLAIHLTNRVISSVYLNSLPKCMVVGVAKGGYQRTQSFTDTAVVGFAQPRNMLHSSDLLTKRHSVPPWWLHHARWKPGEDIKWYGLLVKIRDLCLWLMSQMSPPSLVITSAKLVHIYRGEVVERCMWKRWELSDQLDNLHSATTNLPFIPPQHPPRQFFSVYSQSVCALHHFTLPRNLSILHFHVTSFAITLVLVCECAGLSTCVLILYCH